ncbi:MAG: hypothetical protein ISQ23_06425 [Alphaproteobacteria bacterium]|nr:hypothetical protein [Alphaproteobacteria bacterium]MBL6777131.1 hypothetical protein [Alphaproteobacteria bacterium]
MKTPPVQPDAAITASSAPKEAVARPDARLMRLPERLSAHMQTRSQAGQVFISDAVMSLDAEMKSLHMAIQYASRATSLIQETEEQTGELLTLVNQIRSMARKMTLPDVRDAERQKTESEMNKLWGEVNKIAGQEGIPLKSSEAKISADTSADTKAPIPSKQQALSHLDNAAHQLELQRSALSETAVGVRETIDILTRSGMGEAFSSSDPAMKATIDHVEKSAAVMAERAEMTKAAQSKAATALFTQILHVI